LLDRADGGAEQRGIVVFIAGIRHQDSIERVADFGVSSTPYPRQTRRTRLRNRATLVIPSSQRARAVREPQPRGSAVHVMQARDPVMRFRYHGGASEEPHARTCK
jgi:hypothetical protein